VTNAAHTNSLILITTEDCHFCQRADEILEALDVAAREISVDSDEAAALAAPKPSDGLEPSTPSLPWRCSTN
jgi:hypothetical protein